MASIDPQSTSGAVIGLGLTAASITVGAWLSSKAIQELFDAEFRELPDESLTTQTLAVAVAILILSVSMGAGGRIFAALT